MNTQENRFRKMKPDLGETLKDLCIKARIACDTLPSTQDFEPEFVQVLRYVESHPEARYEFSPVFVEMITNPSVGPWELIPFTMFTLRWDEVRLAAEQELKANPTPQVKSVMAHILDGFSDGWQDADMYATYSTSK